MIVIDVVSSSLFKIYLGRIIVYTNYFNAKNQGENMNDYIQKVNILEEDVARLTTSSNIVYDQTYHMWLIGRTNDLVQEIHNDKGLTDDERGALFTLIVTIFEEVSIDIKI